MPHHAPVRLAVAFIRLATAAAILAAASLAAVAQDEEVTVSHGISAFGDLKYPPDFAHFDYVDPDAPQGRHDEFSRHRRLTDLRQPQPVHPGGRAGAGAGPHPRQPAGHVRRRARRGLRAHRRKPRISRRPLVGDLQPAPRGAVLGWPAHHRRRRGIHPRADEGEGPAALSDHVPGHRERHRAGPAPRALRLRRRGGDAGPTRPRGQHRDFAQALLRDGAVRPLDPRAAGLFRALRRRGGAPGSLGHLLPQSRLLGRGSAGQRGFGQLRLCALRVLRRQHRRLRGVQGGRLPFPRGVHLGALGHQLPLSGGRAGLGDARHAGRPATFGNPGLLDEPASREVPGPTRAPGDRADVQLRVDERHPFPRALRTHRQLLGKLLHAGRGAARRRRARGARAIPRPASAAGLYRACLLAARQRRGPAGGSRGPARGLGSAPGGGLVGRYRTGCGATPRARR